MLSVVCFKWSTPGYRSTFGPLTVNVLRRMVARHYKAPHRFICVTDEPKGLDTSIEVVPDWKDFVAVPSPHGTMHPSCYRRLRIFSPDIAQTFGPRFVVLDIDTLIVGDLAPLWNRPEPFVAWADPGPVTTYNGGMVLLTAGARPQVWTHFDPYRSPTVAKAAGGRGSDQAWISHCLGPHEATWTREDGVYSFRFDILEQKRRLLPANARVVMFHGQVDPWSPTAQDYAWVKEHWC